MKRFAWLTVVLAVMCLLSACEIPELPMDIALLFAPSATAELPSFQMVTPMPPATPTPEPTAEPTPVSTATPDPTPIPTPTPTPEPTPTPDDGTHPNVISVYIPKAGSKTRIRQTEFTGKWTKGQDIDCFEAIASNEETIQGASFKEMFNKAWESFPNREGYKIGYELRYTLKDGSEVYYTITTPSDIQKTEYIECWLYDDIHQKAGVRYTHLSDKDMKDETLITSIKLTCGNKIADVEEIHLTAFIYWDPVLQFDENGHYGGSVKHEITIKRS